MEPGKINGATRTLGAPVNWDPAQGDCGSLPVLDRDTEFGHVMISEWTPTEEERERLAQGLPVHVWVYGFMHPVLSVSVGEIQE